MSPSVQPTLPAVRVLSGRDNNKLTASFREGFKPSDWLVGKSVFAQRVVTLSHPRCSSYSDLTTHPSRGEPTSSPQTWADLQDGLHP